MFDFYSKTMLEIALNIPIPYLDNWHAGIVKEKYIQKVSKLAEENFCVKYDGAELRKPILFSGNEKCISGEFSFEGDRVSAEGYFYATHGKMKPADIQGVLVRIRGSSVGIYIKDFLGFPSTEAALFQNWTSCEIYASDELEEAMNIDRVKFRETHPAFLELRNEFHRQLRDFFKRVLNELYKQRRDERKSEREKELISEITNVTNTNISTVSKKVALEVKKSWSYDKKESRKSVSRSYSPAQVLKMVSEVAKPILPKPLFEELIAEINKLLLK